MAAGGSSVARIERLVGAPTFAKDLAWNSAKKFQQDNCTQLAASITYYVIFSLFPLLIFLASVIGQARLEGTAEPVRARIATIVRALFVQDKPD